MIILCNRPVSKISHVFKWIIIVHHVRLVPYYWARPKILGIALDLILIDDFIVRQSIIKKRQIETTYYQMYGLLNNK